MISKCQLNVVFVAYKERCFQTFIDTDTESCVTYTMDVSKFEPPVMSSSFFANQVLFELFDLDEEIKTDQCHILSQTFSSTQLEISIVVMVNESLANDLLNSCISNNLSYELIEIAHMSEGKAASLAKSALIELKNQYAISSLAGVYYLLPTQFSTQALSLFVSQLTGDMIKRNNVYRYYKAFLDTVRFDKSKPGRPERIMAYRK